MLDSDAADDPNLLKSAVLALLQDPDFERAAYDFVQRLVRKHFRNLQEVIPLVESVRSACYVLDHMRPWQGKDIVRLRFDAIEAAPPGGLFMEFGVWKGNFINLFARHFPDEHFYGFDSFEGLPEDWSDHDRGHFDLGGEPPVVEKNVTLIKGWFSHTLGPFLENHPGKKVSFIHLDCDLYSSSMTVLTMLRDRLQVGTQIVLDDFLLQEGWAQEEHRAFVDFCAGHRISYEFTGWQKADPSVSASVVLTRV